MFDLKSQKNLRKDSLIFFYVQIFPTYEGSCWMGGMEWPIILSHSVNQRTLTKLSSINNFIIRQFIIVENLNIQLLVDIIGVKEKSNLFY